MRVHDPQAYRKMNVTRKRILELREILLSIKTGFSLVNAAVVCAILARLARWQLIHEAMNSKCPRRRKGYIL